MFGYTRNVLHNALRNLPYALRELGYALHQERNALRSWCNA